MMKKITCIAVDDEPLALAVVESFCARIPQLELRCFNSPILAMEHLRSERVDILFLDINMPEMMGLEIAASIQSLPYIIFTTAYAEHAADSYEYNTVGYLLKPYNFERFEKAVQRAMALLHDVGEKRMLSLRIDYRHVLLDVDRILYAEAMGNYVKIYTRSQSYLPQLTMKELELLLDEAQFKRVHRSYIINTTAIESYQRRELTIAGVKIPIGKSYINVIKGSIKP